MAKLKATEALTFVAQRLTKSYTEKKLSNNPFMRTWFALNINFTTPTEISSPEATTSQVLKKMFIIVESEYFTCVHGKNNFQDKQLS